MLTTSPSKPRPKRVLLQPRVSPELLERIRARATAEGLTMNSWVRRLVIRELARKSPLVAA
jgi:hypothetical protein